MYRKAIWIPFILALSCVAVWFIVKAGSEVYDYYEFKVRVEAAVDQWKLQELKSDQFVVLAHYTYIFQGKKYEGEGKVGEVYPNPWAAGQAKERFSKQKWMIWLKPEHPEKSVIEKYFPIKQALSAIVLLGLVLYFCVLVIYMRLK